MSYSETQKAYDAVAAIYDQSYRSSTAKAEDALISLFLYEFLKCGSILDVGCGTGALLKQLKIRRKGYVGIDISPKMIKIAHRKYPWHKFELADVVVATLDAATALREMEQRVKAAKTEEERDAARKDLRIHRLNFVFMNEEAEIVKKVLGTKNPAQKLLIICKDKLLGKSNA